MAGLAGALYVPQVGIINPGEFSPGNSIEAVIWVAVGGRGTLVGPVIGAVLVIRLQSEISSISLSLWPILIGAFFIALVFLFPEGLLPFVTRTAGRLLRRRVAQ